MKGDENTRAPTSASPQKARNSWLSPPKSIRRLFNQFPLLTYDANPLPQRAHLQQDENVLYIFTSVSHDDLSCNPTCLKWQTFLRCSGISCSVRSSNNHASPNGALPFLLPRPSLSKPVPAPIPSSKLLKWVVGQTEDESIVHYREEAYASLIDQDMRNAWLYHLYLNNSNFETVACPLYVTMSSSHPVVHMAIASHLRKAAREELLKSMSVIDASEIILTAAHAFGALSELLGQDKFFFDRPRPGLFDASLFAYIHPLLNDTLNWTDLSLQESLRKYPNLLTHHKTLLEIYLTA